MLLTAARIYARLTGRRFKRWADHAEACQQKVFKSLIDNGRKTAFGQDHGFDKITDYSSFVRQVPVRDYEGIRPYMDRVIAGEADVLWPGQPVYLSKTSGTTSGVKYIPITRASLPNHIQGARYALLMYIYKTGKADFLRGKMIFLSGSPALENQGGIPTGRLSGIAHRHVPSYLRGRRLPSYEVNCIDDWDKKLKAVARQSGCEDLRLISGIPPWVEMYFERLLAYYDAPDVSSLFPNFSLFVYGGVNFQPYEKKFRQLIGREVDSLEVFPASEGFLGFQDEWPSEGLLLMPDSGIFYEFIPADRFGEEDPPRFSLAGVEAGVNYVVILNTNAGLWAYNLGDTIRFVSLRPYRFVSTGRVSHYTSAFGEHVITEEADEAITTAARASSALVTEFTLAPLVDNPNGKPCHQWFVEFEQPPADREAFALALDKALQEKNLYYRDLVSGGILQSAEVVEVPSGLFKAYMKSIGKLGGQNKLPHLSNDRVIADWLLGSMNNAG